jgi:hypothetical protein
MEFVVETRYVGSDSRLSNYINGPFNFREMVKDVVEQDRLGFYADPEWQINFYIVSPALTTAERIIKANKDRDDTRRAIESGS